jgi:hypothetical protein
VSSCKISKHQLCRFLCVAFSVLLTLSTNNGVPGMQADLLINARVRIACELMDGVLPVPGKAN